MAKAKRRTFLTLETERIAYENMELQSYNDDGEFDQDAHLTADEKRIRAKIEGSFYEFCKFFWNLIDTDPYIDNWHIEAQCNHGEAFFFRKIKDMIVNIPPRGGKTNIYCVMLPAWGWVHNNKADWLCTSYSKELSLENNDKCRALVEHETYQKFWGHKVRLGKTRRRSLFKLTEGGSRRATALKSANMGFGGHYVLLDDPTPLDAVTSKSIRDEANRKVHYIANTRVRSGNTPGRLVTQQRVDPDDATGNILRNDHKKRWVHLWIPERYEEYRFCTTVPLRGSKKPWCDPRTEEGEFLDPKWRNDEFLYITQTGLDKHMIEAQFQQNPLLAEGNLIDPAWFQFWEESWYPEFDYVLQSWDTALTDGEKSAFNACTTWGVFRDRYGTAHVLLLDLFSKRMRFPDLRNAVLELDRKWQPDEIVIESKVSGYSVKQDLEAHGLPITGFNPNKYGNKEQRCASISGFIEAGYVWLLTKGPDYKTPNKHGEHLMYCSQYFPHGDPNSDILDIVDSMSQALCKLASRCLLTNRDRIREEDNAVRFIKPTNPEYDIDRID